MNSFSTSEQTPPIGRLEAEIVLLRSALGRLLDAHRSADPGEIAAATANAEKVMGDRD